MLMVGLIFTLQDVCMTQVSCSVSPRNKKGHGKFSQKRALSRVNLRKKGTAKIYLLYVVTVLL